MFVCWEELVLDMPCPIHVTNEEIDLHSEEGENTNGVRKSLLELRDGLVLPVDGKVEPKDYMIQPSKE